MKVPVRTPCASIVHDFVTKADMGAAGISVIMAQVASVGMGLRYPEPEMLPELPGAPLFGVRTKVDSTVNIAVALSPNGEPVAVTLLA